MAEVKIRNLFKSYGNTEVIHGLDVDIEDGEFVVLVGPSVLPYDLKRLRIFTSAIINSPSKK